MTAPEAAAPWMSAWLATQRDFAALAAAWSQPGALQPAFGVPTLRFAEPYRGLFAPPPVPAAVRDPAAAGEALERYRRAADRHGQLLAAIAVDAGARLAAALADTGPESPPITTLRALHALWIDCGEAAWSAAAHEEPFALAQAELLGALVELRAMGQAG